MPSISNLIWKGLQAINELITLAGKAVSSGGKRSRYGGFTASRGVMSGDWVPVLSSWIDAARWEETSPLTRRGTLWIKTLTGGQVYPWAQGISRELARSFFRVQSAGKWIWRHFPPRHLRLVAALAIRGYARPHSRRRGRT